MHFMRNATAVLHSLVTALVLAAAPAASAQETWVMSGVAVGQIINNLPAGIGGIIMPEVISLPDGGYRMWFGGRRMSDNGMDLWYADSPDGSAWTVKGVALAGATDRCDPQFQVAGASIVRLPDGRLRMYYQARQAGPPSPSTCSEIPFQTYSAISSDGVHFTGEGVRVGLATPGPAFGAGHGRVIRRDDGMYVLLFSAGERGTTRQGIFKALSADGLNFDSITLLVYDGHDPYLVRQGNQYVVYIDAAVGGQDAPAMRKGVSTDAWNWQDAGTARFVDDGGNPLTFSVSSGPASPTTFERLIGDVGGAVVDGKLRVYSNWNFSNIVYYQLDTGQVVYPSTQGVEYYHAAFDHYFITAAADEIAASIPGSSRGGPGPGAPSTRSRSARPAPPASAGSSARRSRRRARTSTRPSPPSATR